MVSVECECTGWDSYDSSGYMSLATVTKGESVVWSVECDFVVVKVETEDAECTVCEVSG